MTVVLEARPLRVGRPVPARIISTLALVVAFGFLTFGAAWRIDGGTWERVETPSMGTVAPVGTLLWVKPVDFDSLRPGDFISFRPPGSTGQTYSHRVLARQADGRITTKGVLSSPDPWVLSEEDVVGSVRMRWPGVGWLVEAAPVGIAAGFLVMLVAQLARPRWRAPLVVVVIAVALSAIIAWYRPLVNAEQLAFAPTPGGGADATYVGTGLLPIRLTAHDGPSVVMRAGQVGTVHVGTADEAGKLRLTLAPAVPLWWWAVLVGACFVPAAGAASSSSGRRPAPGVSPPPGRRGNRGRCDHAA
ncbi:hypothetical protein ACVW00_002185 [Marmoricola sp. URHA0025 HA25]